jgi:hypothetical protein
MSGQLLPGGWRVGEWEATATAPAHALEAEPPIAKIDPDAQVSRGRIDLPDVPVAAIAVGEES